MVKPLERGNMRLTENNIAYINEFHFKGGKITISVMLKDYSISNARFYECYYDLIDLPKSVLSFMNKHNKSLVNTDIISQVMQYQYR